MSQATASRMMLADDVAITTNPIWFSFLENSIKGEREFGRDEGHRGTRQRSSCRARVLSDLSNGSFSCKASVTEVDWLFKRVLGSGSGTGGAPWILAEAPAAVYALIDKVAAKYLYPLRLNKLEISGAEAQYLNWMVDVVGGAESVWASAWPGTPSAPECGTAFILADATINYSGTAYPVQSFRLSIDNAFDGQQYENSITPTRFEAQDAIIQLDIQCAFRSDTIALYRAAIAGAVGTLVFTDGTTTYTITFANIKIPNGAPTIPTTGRINMPLQLQAFRTASAEQISIVKS